MMVGGVLGVLFVSLMRRVMVEDPELPFPESVAAAEIHKAGQRGAERGEVSVLQHGLRRGWSTARQTSALFAPDKDFFFRMGALGASKVRLGAGVGATR